MYFVLLLAVRCPLVALRIVCSANIHFSLTFSYFATDNRSGKGVSDAYYCKECTMLEKDRDGCPKIINLGQAKVKSFSLLIFVLLLFFFLFFTLFSVVFFILLDRFVLFSKTICIPRKILKTWL